MAAAVVTEPDAVETVFTLVRQQLRVIKVPVGNAEICPEIPWIELTAKDFRDDLDVNVIGVVPVLTRAAALELAASDINAVARVPSRRR